MRRMIEGKESEKWFVMLNVFFFLCVTPKQPFSLSLFTRGRYTWWRSAPGTCGEGEGRVVSGVAGSDAGNNGGWGKGKKGKANRPTVPSLILP